MILSYIKGDIMEILVLCIAFGASIVGANCGIGDGVIIKSLLDALGIASVAEISFLSGCVPRHCDCCNFVVNLKSGTESECVYFFRETHNFCGSFKRTTG